ncbi:WPP domain-interacting tail-anchored protein 1 isoform X1 [Humulus lupulus]|uniref:WPP domain-interacting tail-anchored protein 1 isoform X1 n=1 Tax=Humulus lupulus TaxID=3486 RepID=UPI002B410FBF|nr:WPP domain-interacting tail-anchored protein 1 isoform X1 [Humulus lupulus]
MDFNDAHVPSVSADHGYTLDQETDMGKVDFADRILVNGELKNAGEFLTQLELDLACTSEKIVNTNVLMMHVATRENDFEAFAAEKEHSSDDSLEKALEFDFLSGVLESEVSELDGFMAVLQSGVFNARALLSSCSNAGETFKELEEKLHDCEQSFKQSLDQFSEIQTHSMYLQRALSCFDRQENGNGHKILEEDQIFNANAEIKMQTAEQQRHILRMLEKSLAREMDLEKKMTELRQVEEELNQRLVSSEQEVYCMGDETEDVWERLFEADNMAVVSMGILKELLGRLQILQLSLNSSAQQETQLRSKLEGSEEELKAKENSLSKLESSNAKFNDLLVAQTNELKSNLRDAEDKLILANSEAFTLGEKVSLLEKELKESEFLLLNAKSSADGSREELNALCCRINEMGNVIADSEERISKAESRAENAETKCKLLTETNMELNEELGLLKSGAGASDKVDSLERQLRESDLQLQCAIASAEASQEKQNLLYSTIADMENLIEDLKLKVLKFENRADSAEDKCIILSESHAELNEELNFLRGRLESLEAVLQQTDETKMTAAEGISFQTKVITNLVMQLAFEREHLHKQISSLATENKILGMKLQESNEHVVMRHDYRGHDKEFMRPKDDLSTATGSEVKEEDTVVSTISSKVEKTQKSVFSGENEVDAVPGPETVRRIDAGILNFKQVFLAMLVMLISATAFYSFQLQKCQL